MIGRSIRPRDIRKLLATPLRPRITTQANARTRKLVQNDRSTRNTRRLLSLAGAVEIR
ncbi:hypothetical protein D3C81_2183610 [compost metagenome]